jgi:Cysteine-rich CPXCG
MRRRRTHEIEGLQRRIKRLDADSIDELYGLEPVWEPAAGQRVSPEEFVAVLCPYCGERLETRVDLSADELSYVEDCEVCCRPIEFHVERTPGGALAAVEARRLD